MNDQFPPRAPLPDSPPMPPKLSVTFDDIEASARAALDRMQTSSEAIDKVRGDASDDDNLVTAVVDGTGRLVDLRIADSAMSMKPEMLSQLLVETAAKAANKAFSEVGEQITNFLDASNPEA